MSRCRRDRAAVPLGRVLGPNVISYSAGSRGEKGKQWQAASALLSGSWEAKLEFDDVSYNTEISACENGEQWQGAFALLSEVGQSKLETNEIVTALTEHCVRKGLAVAEGFGAGERVVGSEAGA